MTTRLRRTDNPHDNEFMLLLDSLIALAHIQKVPRPWGWSNDEILSFVIMNPDYVNARWHQRITVDVDLRERIASWLSAFAPHKVNVPGGAIVICPAV